MMRIFQVLALSTSVGFLVGCSQVPGGNSETAKVFEDNAAEICEGSYEDCTPSEAIEVLDKSVKGESSGSHADLNAAKVALDKGETEKAGDHLRQFIDKTEKERGKKILDDDADFMVYIAQSIIDEIFLEG